MIPASNANCAVIHYTSSGLLDATYPITLQGRMSREEFFTIIGDLNTYIKRRRIGCMGCMGICIGSVLLLGLPLCIAAYRMHTAYKGFLKLLFKKNQELEPRGFQLLGREIGQHRIRWVELLIGNPSASEAAAPVVTPLTPTSPAPEAANPPPPQVIPVPAGYPMAPTSPSTAANAHYYYALPVYSAPQMAQQPLLSQQAAPPSYFDKH